jgi:hypothetical protein
LLVLLAGCSTTSPTLHEGPRFTEAAPPPAGEALVYVYRGYAPPFLFSPAISVDGTKIVDLPNRGYTHVYVKPGEYTIKSQWPLISTAPSREGKFSFAAGETYFVRLGGTMDSSGTLTQQMYTVVSTLLSVPASVGQQEITECMAVKSEVERIR